MENIGKPFIFWVTTWYHNFWKVLKRGPSFVTQNRLMIQKQRHRRFDMPLVKQGFGGGSVVWLPGVQSYRRSCHILSHFLQVFMKPKFLWSLLWWPFKMVFVCIKMLFVEVFFVACLTGNGSSETTLATRRTCWVYSYESTFWAWVDNGAQHLAALSWRR